MLQVTNSKEELSEEELPSIENLGITGTKLKGAQLTLTIEGVTNVTDIALLKDVWADGVAEWLLTICNHDSLVAKATIDKVVNQNQEDS